MYTLLLLLGSFFTSEAQPDKLMRETPINPGEVLEFRLSYGWFTVGHAKWVTDKELKTYQGEECYKFKVTAESTGLLGVFATVNDEWGEYMRTRDYMPMMAYRDLEEGKYILDEKTHFDYGDSLITYERIRKGKELPDKEIKMDKHRVGMLGGFMMMRSVDYFAHKKGDRIDIEAFFEGEEYNMDVEYAGVVELKSKVGRLKAHKIIPKLPENRLFPGKDPITIWISADKSQLPLRADARMYFGTAYVELTDYKNIKFGPDYD
jgi:hypothetical protein